MGTTYRGAFVCLGGISGVKLVQLRILFLSLSNTYETLIEQLHMEEHIVEQFTQRDGVYSRYQIAAATDKINRFYPNYIINNVPSIFLPALETNSIVIGNTEASANLELKKWETRQKAEELGFVLPEVLEECTLNTVSTSYTDTIFVKPKGVDLYHQAWKIPAGTNIKENHNIQFPSDIPAYVEADVQHDIQVDCCFTIHNGSYTINQIIAHNSQGNEKILLGGSETWKQEIEQVTLTEEQESIVTPLFNNWLNYAATLGGSYQGCVTTGLKGTNLYWYEQNSRKGTHTSFTGKGQDWLNSLILDSSESSKTSWSYNL